jgi:hypothetical protein
MAYDVRDPDYAVSPFTGMARRHWVDSAEFLLAGVFGHLRRFDDPVVIPKQHAITYPQPTDPPWRFKAQEFEGLARTLMLAAPLLSNKPDLSLNGLRVRDYYANQVLLATDPASPRYLMTLSEIIARHGVQQYQHTVEGAALAVGLMCSRESIWNRYTRKEKDQVARVISDYAHNRTIGHNWRFFNVLMLTFLKINGYPIDDIALDDHIQHLLSYYVGDGWYRDDETFDYYNPWGFHFYGPIWCSWFGYEHRPDAARIIEERNAEFMRAYPRFFSRSGRQLMWGRSIIYRCAASAAFGAAFLLKRSPLDPGWARRIASGNLLQFIGRNDTFLNNVPCLGYYGPFAPLVQFYSCAASPFWISKAYIALTLPPDSPFWTATENDGVWPRLGDRTERIYLEGPGLGIVNHGRTGATELVPAKAPKRDPFYCQISYNTDLPWEDESPDGATAMSYSIKETGVDEPFRTPLRMGAYRERNGVLYRQFNTKPSGLGDPNKGGVNKGPEKIDLADICIPGGTVRCDRVRVPYKNTLHLAHYGLPHLNGCEPTVRSWSVRGMPVIAAAIPGRQVALVACRGWDGVAAAAHVGKHPESDRSTVIFAHRTHEKDYRGMEILVTVLLHKLGDEPWLDEELDVVKDCAIIPWSESGSPMGARLTLSDGRSLEIDYASIESAVCY